MKSLRPPSFQSFDENWSQPPGMTLDSSVEQQETAEGKDLSILHHLPSLRYPEWLPVLCPPHPSGPLIPSGLLFVMTPAFSGSSRAPRDSRTRVLTLGTRPQQFLGWELGDIIWEQSLFPGGASQGSVGCLGLPRPAVHKAGAATPRTLKPNF